MASILSSKGQVTIPKRLREELQLLPGSTVEFSVNASGQLLMHPLLKRKMVKGNHNDRFEAVRGTADVGWRTDPLMKLLHADE